MGLPIAVWIASQGAKVWACDQNRAVVEAIQAGRPDVDEPGVRELLAEVLAAGRLLATSDTAKAVADSDVVIVIVPAVLTAENHADLRNMEAASSDIARGLRPGTLVVYETTVPVGTTRERMIPILRSSGLEPGTDFHVAYSPERVKSRLVMRYLAETPKVIGGFDDPSAAAAASFYETYLQGSGDRRRPSGGSRVRKARRHGVPGREHRCWRISWPLTPRPSASTRCRSSRLRIPTARQSCSGRASGSAVTARPCTRTSFWTTRSDAAWTSRSRPAPAK